MTRTGSGRSSTSKVHGQTFRRNATAKILSASARTYIVRAIASSGSSTGSSTVDASPLATTSLRPTISRSCSWHPSVCGCAFMSSRPVKNAPALRLSGSGQAICSLPRLLSESVDQNALRDRPHERPALGLADLKTTGVYANARPGESGGRYAALAIDSQYPRDGPMPFEMEALNIRPALRARALSASQSGGRNPAAGRPWREYVLAGGLMSYGVNLVDQWRRTASSDLLTLGSARMSGFRRQSGCRGTCRSGTTLDRRSGQALRNLAVVSKSSALAAGKTGHVLVRTRPHPAAREP